MVDSAYKAPNKPFTFYPGYFSYTVSYLAS